MHGVDALLVFVGFVVCVWDCFVSVWFCVYWWVWVCLITIAMLVGFISRLLIGGVVLLRCSCWFRFSISWFCGRFVLNLLDCLARRGL